MSYGAGRGARGGLFDGLPIPNDKAYLREQISRLDEGWVVARFDSLPHVVRILTSKDREGDINLLRDQSDLVEDVVDEVVHAYHQGFNKAIQNYSHILRLFSESAESISGLKSEMAEAKQQLGSRNKQLGQLWYRSLTLRHVLSLMDQIEDVSMVPGRIEKLVADKQLYAAVQLHVQSMLMLDREGLQTVGALQEVRSELIKLRGMLFYKVFEELHSHIYNIGDYSSATSNMLEGDGLSTTGVLSSGQPLSRRTKSMRGNSYNGGPPSVDGGSSIDDDDSSIGTRDNDGSRPKRDNKSSSQEIPSFLSCATPDEFVESMTKTDAPINVRYLQTLVECLCKLGKVAAAGAIICQRLRTTVHEVITSKIKAYSEENSKKPSTEQDSIQAVSPKENGSRPFISYHMIKKKTKNGSSFVAAQLVVSPISPSMAPMGAAQRAANQLLSSIFDSIVLILGKHIIVGELLEEKATSQGDIINTPKTAGIETNWNADSESSRATGGFSVALSLSVIQSECQQLIREILRATPEAAAADAAAQPSRVSNKDSAKEKRGGSEGFSFAFRITDSSASVSTEASDQAWRRGTNVQQDGYGTSVVLPDEGIFLAASVYRPVLELSEKVRSMLPQKYSHLGNDALLTFMRNILKDHFLPAICADYRKCVQQAISSPSAFRPRLNATSAYDPSVEKGRPVLQGLLAVDVIAKEVLSWGQLIPSYASELVEYIRAFLERAQERCRTLYMEAVLEKQSYILLSRNDVENLMQRDPANAFLQPSGNVENNISDVEVEIELSDLLWDIRPIKQDNLIHDDQKIILLASLSDSLEYLADSVESLGESLLMPSSSMNSKSRPAHGHRRRISTVPKSLEALANEYRKLAVDCLKVLRLELQLETIFHLQEMSNREYIEDQGAEDPDDFIISLATQVARREEEIAPFMAEPKRHYIFGGISTVAAHASIRALSQMKSINLLGVQQICRNSIALEQALTALPSANREAVKERLARVQTYYELLNLPFDTLLANITENKYLFSFKEYLSLVKVNVPGRTIPNDAEQRVSQILSH